MRIASRRIDRRRSHEPLLVGLNVRMAADEIALLESLARRRGLTKSSFARKLLVDALAKEVIDADSDR